MGEKGNAVATWAELILKEMRKAGEPDAKVVGSTLTEDEMNREFFAGFGSPEGDTFTLWTEKRVYFPVTGDGSEWVGSAPRHPCEEKTDHQGG
jgi:hypothetical protein